MAVACRAMGSGVRGARGSRKHSTTVAPSSRGTSNQLHGLDRFRRGRAAGLVGAAMTI